MNRDNSNVATNAAKSSPRATQEQGRILLDEEWSDRLGLTPEALRALLAFNEDGVSVLSMYMTVDPAERTKYQSRLHLKDLFKSSEIDPGQVAEDIARAADYLQNEYDWQSEGLAIFSCVPRKLWQVVRLPMRVQDHVTVAARPYVRPLLGVLTSPMRYAVALVDREVLRVFGIYLGEIKELGEKRRLVPKHHKQNEASPKLQRQAEEAALQNLKQAAEDAVGLFDKFNAKQIILGGQAEPMIKFKEYLPKAWQALVIAELALDTNANASQVIAKAKEVIGQFEERRQRTLVDGLINDAQKKGVTGTLGLSDTLNALTEGKVMSLIIAQDYSGKGYECVNCDYLAADQVEPCPVCGHHMRLVDHAVDLAIRKALENDARVETICVPDAAMRLKELGGIGAMLRY
jgi:peptide subunit release factor 1 (eRF1)